MAYKFIKSAADGAVTTLTIARPDKLNALTPNVFDELADAIDKALAEGARALVLTGDGRAFSSGADLQRDGAGYEGLPDDLGQLLADHYEPFVRKMMDLPVPLVVAVNGPAVGAGLSLALAGDITVAARSAYFLLAFVNIGLVPDAGASWLVTRNIGRARALEMALLGEKVEAVEAQAMGLVNRVLDDTAVLAEAQAIAKRLANGPTKAIGMIRKQMNAAAEKSLGDTLTMESANQSECGYSEDFAEAIAAFADKRKPEFKGR